MSRLTFEPTKVNIKQMPKSKICNRSIKVNQIFAIEVLKLLPLYLDPRQPIDTPDTSHQETTPRIIN